MSRMIGGYEILEKIGSGATGIIYKAVQKSLDRTVAIKVLYPYLAEDQSFIARFRREAMAAAALKHPNIVDIIDFSQSEETYFIAMEFIDGVTLSKLRETEGSIPLEVAILLLREVLKGLVQAHGVGLVHRDIKPGNIMFTKNGDVKIADFGLARKTEDAQSVTVTGSVLGTPAYMSPEQASGQKVDERSDIFSLGVVAFEILGGEKPFRGDSYSAVIHQILTTEAPDLTTLNPLVPEEVHRIVSRMLQKEASKRYQHLSAALRDLDAWLETSDVRISRSLLPAFARDPKAIAQELKKRRLTSHLNKATYYMNQGLSRIDDAIQEFRRVLYIDPGNVDAKKGLDELEARKRAGITAVPGDATILVPGTPPEGPRDSVDSTYRTRLVLPPEDATLPPVRPPAPVPAAAPSPAPGAPPRPAVRARKVPVRLMVVAGALVVLVGGGFAALRFGGLGVSGLAGRVPTDEKQLAGAGGDSATVPDGGATATGAAGPGDGTDGNGATEATGAESGDAEAERLAAEKAAVEKAAADKAAREKAAAEQAAREKAARDKAARDKAALDLAAKQQAMKDQTEKPPAGGTGSAAVTPPSTRMAVLRLSSEPEGATVVVDGTPVAGKVTPMTLRDLKPGRREVKVQKEGYREYVRNVTLSPGDDAKLDVTLSASRGGSSQSEGSTAAKVPGQIQVSCEGGLWGFVYLNGRKVGNTPWLSEPLAADKGPFKIEVRRPGFKTEEGEVAAKVKPGETVYLVFHLKKTD